MFVTKKTVISSTGKISSKLSESLDDLMGKGMDTLNSGMKVMEEAFKEAKTDEAVTTTIRIRLTLKQIEDLHAGTPQTFKADGTTIRLEREKL